MTITQLTDTEFQFECEGDKEAKAVQALEQFDFNGGTYFVKHITPSIDTGSYKSFFVVAR